MTENHDPKRTVVCLASHFKGEAFLRQVRELGHRVVLITKEKLRDEPWPHESLDGFVTVGDRAEPDDYLRAVTEAAQRVQVSRVVALEEFDVVTAGLIREHLLLSGMTGSEARRFRDKLLMRTIARSAGLLVPEFVHPLNPEVVNEYVTNVPGPWVLKPRSDVSAIGIRKIGEVNDLWTVLNELNDRELFRERPSNYVLEQYLPGQVFHVDSIVSGGRVAVALANQYGRPPMDVAHGGGVFVSHTVKAGSQDERALLRFNRKIISALGLRDGVAHAEFIKAQKDSNIYFLEIAARVGGAFLADTFEAATGLSLWREWAKIELAPTPGSYNVKPLRRENAGIALSLARQEHPDTSSYTDPEIVYRVHKPYHVGLVVRSPRYERVHELLDEFAYRYADDFCAIAPPRERVE